MITELTSYSAKQAVKLIFVSATIIACLFLLAAIQYLSLYLPLD